MTNNTLILVDGSSYLFRAYYALPALTNSKGKPTGAIYGVISMLRKLLSDYASPHVAVVFDPKGKTFRHELYQAYKANRAVMPDELAQQIAPLHEIIKAMGLPLIIEPGIEADDVIGTLTKRATKNGMKVLISTGDKDIAQLVDANVTLINTMTNVLMDSQGVVEKFGVKPDQIIDYLALIGDTSDNVPGVPKVGPKTAVKWLTQYHSIQNIVQHATEIGGKVGENLREFIPQLPLSVELVTIKTDIALTQSEESLCLKQPDHAQLQYWFAELEFKKWLADVSDAQNQPVSVAITPTTKTASHSHYDVILDQDSWRKWQRILQQATTFAFDTETTSIEAMQARLVGLSFAVENKAAYVPLRHDYAGAPTQLTAAAFLKELAPFLQDPQKTVVGQNLKYDIEVMRHEGVEISASLRDTLLESYVINSTASRHSLDALAKNYLDKDTVTFEAIAGKGTKQLTFNEIAIETAAHYAAEDADVALQLDRVLYPQITAVTAYQKVFSEIEMPLMPILARMEYRGVLIDAALLEKQSQTLAHAIAEYEQKAYALAGEQFNLSSPKQLQEILYDKMKIPVLKKTPGGQPSTAEPVLQDLSHDYELPAVILHYRSLAKLKSTYTDKLPQQINAKTGRVHTSYNQAVTSTGRLSSNNPNLQNIPIRTQEGRRIREAFIAPAGFKIVAADYSQVELRIVAHISQDPGLLNAFKHNQDVHAATASEVFGIALDKVTAEHRRAAKAINFGLLYGMSAFGLAKQLGIGRNEAQQHMDVYFKKYPKVHAYMEQARQLACAQGYVETLFGRRLYIPLIQSKNRMQKMAAERAAINAPMQGTAADIIKIAMINVDRWLREEKIAAHMVMQVHDELIFEVDENALQTVVASVKQLMQNAVELSVPLIVDVGIGDNWGAAH